MLYTKRMKPIPPWVTLALLVLFLASVVLCFAYKVKLDGYVKASQQQTQKP
jgi:hypothetical protein